MIRVILIFCLILPVTAYCEENENPFNAFFGEWTLKDDKFQQVWDGKTVETLEIKNHFTNCKAINTNKSILCVVDAGDLKGHILWTYDSAKSQVHHLSHFGDSRTGVGIGVLDDNGNLTTTVTFQGEPEGSYRVYEYIWLSKDEYSMYSKQYDSNGKLIQ